MTFDPKKFIETSVKEIQNKIGNERAIIAVSGGVDSFVAATIASKAVPGQLHSVYVDNGLMRKNETQKVTEVAKRLGVTLNVIDGRKRFLDALKGIIEPEQKRKIIGEMFVRVFEEEAKKHNVKFLIQGTIAPDWIESGGMGRDTIKSHHNVGGLPEKMHLKLCEPLRELYKHEVRMLGKELGLPEEIHQRQPFPGPGLAVRIVGEITEEKVKMVQEACEIVETEIDNACKQGKMERPWQYFAALLPSKTVGVRGDERAYQYTMIIRAVRSLDGMTANFSHIPFEILEKISTRITNEIHTVGRVTYDITNKPPGTIEME
ncbi:glutamine-hydrolyzing GMP synthase [Candidatus Micrarchaeota archaeon]|nr:glutamine-hydrolyzing GMP synthase [Candidatus Micrarchaeota archaeon]MBU1166446.1 glutamine-hydrolyzing GMP synthase [Candidatus Micrarchaeota archaeon]MBU1886547.1 glutamine-hydrolyzing GMP synthase [Candidatus Micrarchaeota archaeon]